MSPDAKDKEQVKSRKPANTAFKQQRLKAWQPILTPKSVLPAFIIIGILFAPLGGLLLWASDTVAEIVIDYTNCDKAGTNYVPVPSDLYSSNFPSSSGDGNPPEFKAIPAVGASSNATWPTMRCTIKFDVPVTMKHPVFMYYRLTDFYQNHRRYIKSLDLKQLSGESRTAMDLRGGGCEPMATVTEGELRFPIYPCGLIANSMFNDTLDITLNPFNTSDLKPYNMTDKGIAWTVDQTKYISLQHADLSQIRPPPNWEKKYPNGYTTSNPPLDISQDEHFQVWMRASGLPNFRKMFAKNEKEDLAAGTYTIDIDMNYNVSTYGGTKSIVLSTVSFMGGRNPFLGIAFIVVGVLCVFLGLLFTARHLYKPRRLGDHTYLSWNQNQNPRHQLNDTDAMGAGSETETEDLPTATASGASARY
ncbi:hypothetical protein BGX30_006860 [Mortierella sp. GBA39]|nr:hypothetical protein BGX30_006860 [Mortierella sp. GBA39]